MKSVFTRLCEVDYSEFTKLRTKKDIFKEFNHNFGDRVIHMDYDMFEDGIKWLMYNGKTIYSVDNSDFSKMIRFIGLTVYEFMVLVYHECAINPKFFISEICRHPEVGGTYTKYVLDIGKYAQLTAFEEDLNTLLYNPRQTGSTMLLCALYLWVTIFRSWSANILVPSRSKTDYDMFKEKIELVKDGLPKVFFSPEITSSFHYRNNSHFVNYIFINDFEFLKDNQFQYIDNINNIKTKSNIGIYPGTIGFSTRVQIVGNSTINSKPSDILKSFIKDKFISLDEPDFDRPKYALSKVQVPNAVDSSIMVNIPPKDYYKYILEIKFDEINIMTQDKLQYMANLIPPEYYDTEIRRIRPSNTK